MARYRKKPVVIHAEQSFPGKEVAGVEIGVPPGATGEARLFCRTLEGWHDVTPGDWIITGIKGEKYPCKSDVFQATYEPAE